jgi:hypothetical protein
VLVAESDHLDIFYSTPLEYLNIVQNEYDIQKTWQKNLKMYIINIYIKTPKTLLEKYEKATP